MKQTIIFMICLFIMTSFTFADFTAADRIKLEKALKNLNLDKKLPTVLTVKGWQKKRKSADLSKKTQKTGIADKLKTIETNYKEISGKNESKIMFPNVLAEALSAADVTNAIKIGRDKLKDMSLLKNNLDELEQLAKDAKKVFDDDKEELEKNATKNKKKIQKIQIAIDAVADIAGEAKKLSTLIEQLDPNTWRDKYNTDKDEAVAFAKGTDELKRSGVKPDKLIQAVFTMDVIFGGKLIEVCDDYLNTVVPDLENLRDNPVALAGKFNGSYLANDGGSRKVSQNTSNIKRWATNFGANFLYSTADITDVIQDFDGWGGGTDPWTEENAVANLVKYKKDLEDLKSWATQFGNQWDTDKNN